MGTPEASPREKSNMNKVGPWWTHLNPSFTLQKLKRSVDRKLSNLWTCCLMSSKGNTQCRKQPNVDGRRKILEKCQKLSFCPGPTAGPHWFPPKHLRYCSSAADLHPIWSIRDLQGEVITLIKDHHERISMVRCYR